jgi:prephenate dehydrogenase
MSIQITIVGLGQIGTSIGLALKGKMETLRRVGHDLDIKIARQAEKMGAVDRVEINLPKSVREAELVILSLPLDQLKETLRIIAPDLKEGAVVMDTGPVKEIVATWAGELLPAGRYYVGLTPVIRAEYLHDIDSGIEAARADLFQDGLIAIVAPPRADSSAIKLAADLTRLLGANPLFADPMEVDGLMAATHLLPQLMAAALLNATVDQPGWREARKMAGRAYAEATAPMTFTSAAEALSALALLNRDNTLRVVDGAIAALHAIRKDIDQEDETSLKERLERARAGRLTWWQGRQSPVGPMDEIQAMPLPENPGVLGRLFGVGRRPKTSSEK